MKNLLASRFSAHSWIIVPLAARQGVVSEVAP